jgi:hypothetical protein
VTRRLSRTAGPAVARSVTAPAGFSLGRPAPRRPPGPAAARQLAEVAGRRQEPLSAFPLAGTLRARLGRAVPGEAVLDEAGCAARGVEAFTDHGRSHFATAAPRLEVAAHEAAHQLQHAGLTHDACLGPEGHAGAVAGAVQAGRSAAGLLGPAGRRVAPAARPFIDIPPSAQAPGEWDAGAPLRVADDLQMAVAQDTARGSQRLWATQKLIATSNNMLASKNSPIRLGFGSHVLTGTPPPYVALGMPGTSPFLYEVVPQNVANQTAGSTMELWDDCGFAAREVMGIGAGYLDIASMTAIWIQGGVQVKARGLLNIGPADMAGEIVKRAFGTWTQEGGWEAYRALTPSQRDAFDQAYGINAYVPQPTIGEGFAIVGGGEEILEEGYWLFHVAAVAMKSGDDVVVLENYQVGSEESSNDDWNFQIFGGLGQTFHELHEADLEHGTAPTTFKVGPD